MLIARIFLAKKISPETSLSRVLVNDYQLFIFNSVLRIAL